MSTVKRVAKPTTKSASPLSAAVSSAKEILKVIEEGETAIDTLSTEVESNRWELSSLVHRVVKEEKLAAGQTFATKVGVTPSYVSQLCKVAASYGDPDFRSPKLSFNDHLELVRIPEEDRDKVIEEAAKYGTSISTTRQRLAREQKEKAIRAEARAEAKAEGVPSVASAPDDGKPKAKRVKASLEAAGGPVGRARLELKEAVGDLADALGRIQVALTSGGRLNANEAAELKAMGAAVLTAARTAGTPGPAEAAEASPEAAGEAKKVRRVVVRQKAA